METFSTCPRSSSALLSRLTWAWMDPFISLGNKRPLKMEDLYDLEPSENAAYCQHLWDQCEKTKKLWRIMLRFLGRDYFLPSLQLPLWIGFQILQVYVLRAILDLVHSGKKLQWWWGSGLVFAMFLLSMLQSLSQNYLFFKSYRAGLRMRAAICMAIFRKICSTKLSSLSTSDRNQMINLVATDTVKLIDGLSYFHYSWTILFTLPLMALLLLMETGIAALPGIGLIFIAQPLQLKVGKHLRAPRMRAYGMTDKRVGIISEVLTGIKALKYNGWTELFLEKIARIRTMEIGYMQKSAFFRALLSALRDGSVPLACTATFGVYAAHQKLSPGTAFTVLSFYSILGKILFGFCSAIPYAAELLVNVERLQKILQPSDEELAEVEKQKKVEVQSTSQLNVWQENENVVVEVCNCTFSWEGTSRGTNEPQAVLQDLSFSVHKGEHICITGEIGSGKSSLLLGLLGELQVLGGHYRLLTRAAYATQQPWILNASVRENILFGNHFDEARYTSVLSACALESDLLAWPDGDNTEIGERGINLSGGQKARLSLARACYDSASLLLLDDPFSAVDVRTARHLIQHVLGGLLKDRTVVVATHSAMCIEFYGSTYVLRGRKLYPPTIGFTSIRETDLDASQPSEDSSTPDSSKTSGQATKGALVKEETCAAGDSTCWSYIQYAKMANWSLWFAAVVAFLLAQATILMLDYWLRIWVDRRFNLSQHLYVVSFASIAVSVIPASLFRASLFYKAALTAASNMHEVMAERVLRSPIRFFEQNPAGRILNRFTSDMGIVDDSLPILAETVLEHVAASLGCLVLIPILVPWFLLAMPPFLFALTYFRQRYVAVCCVVKKLDGVSRSPVYAHFSEAMEGAVSIRAYHAESRFQTRFQGFLEANLKVLMMYLHSTRWLAIRMDFISSVCIAAATLLVVLLRNKITAGLAGVIMVQSLKLTGLMHFAIRVSGDVENCFTSVERILEYCNLQSEANPQTKPGVITDEWPSKGGIAFIDYTMAYREDLPPALHQISFTVEPMEKIGIVGRTGAGKSSLVTALFRMVENAACNGCILVDGVDIKAVGLDDLRQRLSIIPQEPVLFTGTVRFNLDPVGKYSDAEIRDVLKLSHLLAKVESLDNALDSEMVTTFSLGERQLLCLARSLLGRSKLLILDEATASVDVQTDRLIQTAIRQTCQACTVLTVAHRINTIIDADRILVLDKGKVVEFDTPANLLSITGGMFQAMITQSGGSELKALSNKK